MKTILFILQKEFIQIFRNKVMLPIIFIVPLIQLLILVNAATLEIKNIKTIIIDKDLSPSSRKLVSKIEGSTFFVISGYSTNIKEGNDALLRNDASVVLHIPYGFEQKLNRQDNPKIQVLINAVNSTNASLFYSYTSSVIQSFQSDLIVELTNGETNSLVYSCDIRQRFWYNPYLNFHIYMTPAVLVILVTIIGMFLTALNIVREKEMGTLEQINVTPIKKYQFIAGKLIPFWIIALIELTVGLIAGILIFKLPVVGNILHLYVFAALYLIVALGLGLFFSTLAESQQQVMFIAFFFMVTFILMSGIFTPAESMPEWAQKINIINPFAYFIKAIRMILLKGSGLNDIKNEIYSLVIYSIVILSLAIWRYRKVA